MHDSVKLWAQHLLEIVGEDYITGKRVLEVGSHNVNGSLKPYIMQYNPSHYGGIDPVDGPGVDMPITVEQAAAAAFPPESFDVVVSTEMLEHTPDWCTSVASMMCLLKTDGLLILTTRSVGFPYHGFPHDYWRFSRRGMVDILDRCRLTGFVRRDPDAPGVFVAAVKWRHIPSLELISVLREVAEGVTPMQQPS